MSRPGDTTQPHAFARLREAFHACFEAEPQLRTARLESLRLEDPLLAAELEGLLKEAERTPSARAERIGAFRLCEEIGRGGMGVVWRAERSDADFRQVVALKLLHGGAHSGAATRRFLREWRVLARLQHPGIARLIDAGVDAGRPWLAMEFVDGAPFAQACASAPLVQRVQWLVEACDALAYAHARLVLHRDIKPANLRLGADGRLRVLDFGIARLLDDGDDPTQAGVSIGTPRYAAPEQLRGETVATPADVFALGRVLDECHGGDGLLAAIAARACAQAAEERYPGVNALADDLRDWLAGRSPRSGAGSPRERLRRWLWQRRWPLGSAAAVTLALAIGLYATWNQAQHARGEAERARAHLAALLDVIGAASPEDFVGHDPGASKFLVEAARRLRALPGTDPELQWQSLAQIGNGLINLQRGGEAVPILQAALEAIERWPHPQQAARRLDGLRLLLLALQETGEAAEVDATIARIEAASAQTGVPAGAALSALASAAAVCSRRGDFVRSRALFAQAQPLLSAADIAPGPRENYFRQRGWAALRERALDEAQPALQAALTTMDQTPSAFSALRRAEAHGLLAELALQRGDASVALAELALATPVYEREYPPEHAERGALARMWARASLLAGKPADAARWLEQVQRAAASGEAEDARQSQAVTAQVAAVFGRCTEARAALARLDALPAPTLLPHRQSVEDDARRSVQACASTSSALRPEGRDGARR